MVLRARIVLASFLFFHVGIATAARADPISLPLLSPFRLLSSGGEVTIHFVGSEAAFDSSLFLSAPREQGPFFPNHTTPVGDSASLGIFARDAELIFRLRVFTTGDDFFTGPASRNPDGVLHARASIWAHTPSIPTSGVLVGFEDLFGGGDGDFNDFQFVVANAKLVDASPVPEPSTLLLFATGAAAFGRRAWKRRNTAHVGGTQA